MALVTIGAELPYYDSVEGYPASPHGVLKISDHHEDWGEWLKPDP